MTGSKLDFVQGSSAQVPQSGVTVKWKLSGGRDSICITDAAGICKLSPTQGDALEADISYVQNGKTFSATAQYPRDPASLVVPFALQPCSILARHPSIIRDGVCDYLQNAQDSWFNVPAATEKVDRHALAAVFLDSLLTFQDSLVSLRTTAETQALISVWVNATTLHRLAAEAEVKVGTALVWALVLKAMESMLLTGDSKVVFSGSIPLTKLGFNYKAGFDLRLPTDQKTIKLLRSGLWFVADYFAKKTITEFVEALADGRHEEQRRAMETWIRTSAVRATTDYVMGGAWSDGWAPTMGGTSILDEAAWRVRQAASDVYFVADLQKSLVGKYAKYWVGASINLEDMETFVRSVSGIDFGINANAVLKVNKALWANSPDAGTGLNQVWNPTPVPAPMPASRQPMLRSAPSFAARGMGVAAVGSVELDAVLAQIDSVGARLARRDTAGALRAWGDWTRQQRSQRQTWVARTQELWVKKYSDSTFTQENSDSLEVVLSRAEDVVRKPEYMVELLLDGLADGSGVRLDTLAVWRDSVRAAWVSRLSVLDQSFAKVVPARVSFAQILRVETTVADSVRARRKFRAVLINRDTCAHALGITFTAIYDSAANLMPAKRLVAAGDTAVFEWMAAYPDSVVTGGKPWTVKVDGDSLDFAGSLSGAEWIGMVKKTTSLGSAPKPKARWIGQGDRWFIQGWTGRVDATDLQGRNLSMTVQAKGDGQEVRLDRRTKVVLLRAGGLVQKVVVP